MLFVWASEQQCQIALKGLADAFYVSADGSLGGCGILNADGIQNGFVFLQRVRIPTRYQDRLHVVFSHLLLQLDQNFSGGFIGAGVVDDGVKLLVQSGIPHQIACFLTLTHLGNDPFQTLKLCLRDAGNSQPGDKAFQLHTQLQIIQHLLMCLTFLTPLVSKVVLYFGAPEQFMMAMVGLGVIAASSKQSLSKGILSGFFGLALATIGYDAITGFDRFTFGSIYMADGVEFMAIVVGLFGLSQAISLAESARTITGDTKLSGNVMDGAKAVFRNWKVTLRGTVLGILLGVTPGAGGSAASMLAYSTTQSSEPDGDTFGKGNIKGVIAPEAANNATIGSAIIPTLAFGIPGSPTCAVLMGLLMIHNIIPGPRLFVDSPDTLYTFFWGLTFTCAGIVIIGIPLLRFFAKVTVVPYQILVPAITILCFIGSYSIRGYIFDVFVMIFFGIIGYFLKKANWPMVCFVLGLVLGSNAETNLFRSMIIYGDLSFLVKRPITLALTVLLLFVVIWPFVKDHLPEKKRK